jgi:hypothetical protein
MATSPKARCTKPNFSKECFQNQDLRQQICQRSVFRIEFFFPTNDELFVMEYFSEKNFSAISSKHTSRPYFKISHVVLRTNKNKSQIFNVQNSKVIESKYVALLTVQVAPK